MNAAKLVKEASAKGMKFVRNGSLNGNPAYKLADAQKHGYAADPFGRSAALFTKYDIARHLEFGSNEIDHDAVDAYWDSK